MVGFPRGRGGGEGGDRCGGGKGSGVSNVNRFLRFSLKLKQDVKLRRSQNHRK